jgi:hypothetical protein
VAVIVVYLYGVFTLMARNFDGVEKSVLLGGIVNYFPAFSSIQVNYHSTIIPKTKLQFLSFFDASSVFNFSRLAEFRSHCRQPLW